MKKELTEPVNLLNRTLFMYRVIITAFCVIIAIESFALRQSWNNERFLSNQLSIEKGKQH